MVIRRTSLLAKNRIRAGRIGRRVAPALLLGAFFALAACDATGSLTLQAGYAWITVINPNNASNGTFTYSNIYLDDPTNIEEYSLPANTTGNAEIQFQAPYGAVHKVAFQFTWSSDTAPSAGSSWTQYSTTAAQEGPYSFLLTSAGYTITGPLWK